MTAVGCCRRAERQRAGGESALGNELGTLLKRVASVRAELRAAVDIASSWQGEGSPPDDLVRSPVDRVAPSC